jgi:DMSO/TMAO reductase YedYZ heme-binding membrane subunit
MTHNPPTRGNIRALLALTAFTLIALHFPELIAWIGGAQ